METVNKQLSDELLHMAEVDQDMRTKVINLEGEWDSSIDETNQSRMIEIVDEEGWPTIPMVGEEASNAAWLIVQHAPSLEFMEKCLQLMKSYPASEVNPANIAYMEDRVLMLNSKPQIYGTQFQGTGKDMHVYTVEDPEHVDERRASVGLGTFAENEERIRKNHTNLTSIHPKS